MAKKKQDLVSYPRNINEFGIECGLVLNDLEFLFYDTESVDRKTKLNMLKVLLASWYNQIKKDSKKKNDAVPIT